jgi:nitric oxide reductase NorD protein
MSDDAPDLHLDWEERVVGRLFGWWRKLKPVAQAVDAAVVAYLADEEDRLRVLAQLFAGGRLHVRPSEASGGVRGQILLLPTQLTAGPDTAANVELYVLRSVIEGTRVQLGLATLTGDPLADEVHALAGAARAMAWLLEDFEGFGRRLVIARGWVQAARPAAGLSLQGAALEVLRMDVLKGGLIADPAAVIARLRGLDAKGTPSPPVPLWGGALGPADQALAAAIEAEEAAAIAAAKITTEIAAPPKDHVERAFLEQDPDADVMPMHTFEKVDFLDPFNGMMRRLDGSDELEDHLDALDEVDLRHVVRGGEAAESVYRAELDGLSTIPDVHHIAPGEAGLRYDEWFQAERRYKTGWVTVYPSEAPAGDDTWAAERLAELSGLRRKLLRRLEGERAARQWVGRQPDGDEIDLSALIEAYGDHRAGRPGSPRLYRRNPRRRRDNATTVLIDISLSADSWVDNRRVLDVSRDAVLLLGEVAEALGDQFEVLAFASNTRNHCRVWRIKGWRESWRTGRHRLGALSPTGYTRIGPALRHATARLDAQAAERKLLLLITDGKPNDYDRYEGAHGVADVRQATREAARDGIRVHAIGIDPSAARALPAMFGVGGSQLLSTLAELPEALVQAYGEAT